MWAHHLLTFYRTLARQWLFAALNVLGLAVGIAVFVVLLLDVRFEASFDDWIPDGANIYRFDSTFSLPGAAPMRAATSASAIAPAFRTDYPHAGHIARMVDSERPVANGALLGSEHMDYVDTNFFDVLDLPLAAGDRHLALADPDGVVITKAVARRYFGTTAVLGRPLTLYFHGKARTHRITGVFEDLPANTNLKLAVVAPLTLAMESDPDAGLDGWGNLDGYTFVRFAGPAQARAVIADLANFVRRRAHDSSGGATDITSSLRLGLTPLRDLHFSDASRRWAAKPGADARLIYALGLVGVLTLVIAALNYVNLATARSALRAREIALRKVMGATRGALVVQLLTESVVFALAAVLIGLALAELSLPLVNALIGGELGLTYVGAGGVLAWALALALAIGLGAGAYPALLLSRFEPAAVLASARTPGGGRADARVRSLLIGAQFVIAVVFTICTLVIGAEARFIRNADRGFRRDGLVLLDNLGAVLVADRQNEILDALRRVPGVVSATASFREPGLPNDGVLCVRRPGAGHAGVSIAGDVVGDDYLKTYGARVVAGRMFDRAHGADDIAGPYRGPSEPAARGIDVMLNESAVRALGFASPQRAIGQLVFTLEDCGVLKGRASPIIGVLDDLRFGSPQSPVPAVVYRYDSKAFTSGANGAVRFAGVSDAEMIARLRTAWSRVAPSVPFLAETAQERLSDYYVPDEQRSTLFAVGSALAVAIGCVGLYGLAAFNTARRIKEIGIRKTLGASTAEVLRLLLAQILRPVLIANLIAWPLAWLAMRQWLASFDQRIALSPLFFLAASVLALMVAALTVVAQALRLAGAEPAKALRHE